MVFPPPRNGTTAALCFLRQLGNGSRAEDRRQEMNAKTTLSGHVNHNETLVQESAGSAGVRVKTRVRGGRLASNHNETLVRDRA